MSRMSLGNAVIPNFAVRRLKKLLSHIHPTPNAELFTASATGHLSWHELHKSLGESPPSPTDESLSPQQLAARRAYQALRIAPLVERHGGTPDLSWVLIEVWQPTASRPEPLEAVKERLRAGTQSGDAERLYRAAVVIAGKDAYDEAVPAHPELAEAAELYRGAVKAGHARAPLTLALLLFAHPELSKKGESPSEALDMLGMAEVRGDSAAMELAALYETMKSKGIFGGAGLEKLDRAHAAIRRRVAPRLLA